MALRYFRQIDLADTHVAIDGGVHIAALGGIGLTAVFGFAGLSLHQRRSRDLKTRIEQAKQRLEATLEAGEPMTLV